MPPVTRLQSRRFRRDRKRPRIMDGYDSEQFFARSTPYNTRSSPQKPEHRKEEKSRVSYSWNKTRRALFLSLCVEEHNNGKRAGTGLKAEAYRRIAQQLTSTFGDPCSETQVRNFWLQQKQVWKDANTLRSATGLGIDPWNESIAADEEWWEKAIRARPDMARLKNKNIAEILHFGDILFKNVTSTGEHVLYPARAPGSQGLAAFSRRLDLNSGPNPDDESVEMPHENSPFVDLAYSNPTPASRSSTGGKRKSAEIGSASQANKKMPGGLHLLEKFEQACKNKAEKEAELELCMQSIHELEGRNPRMAMYGSTLLGRNADLRPIFLRWKTLESKEEWLSTMLEMGYR